MGSPQLGSVDMNQMGGYGSYNGGGYKQNYGQSHHKNQENHEVTFYNGRALLIHQKAFQGKEANQGQMGAFGGNMAGNGGGNYGMQATGYGYGGNQGGFGAQK